MLLAKPTKTISVYKVYLKHTCVTLEKVYTQTDKIYHIKSLYIHQFTSSKKNAIEIFHHALLKAIDYKLDFYEP